jgi:hypothetical protein
MAGLNGPQPNSVRIPENLTHAKEVMSTPVEEDINKVIASAVNARVEAKVAEALAGDEMIGRYVTAALMQEIEVGGTSYTRRKTTFLRYTIDEAMRGATQAAVKRVIAEEMPAIERAVRAQLLSSVDTIAAQLAGSVVDAADRSYGIHVELNYPSRD